MAEGGGDIPDPTVLNNVKETDKLLGEGDGKGKKIVIEPPKSKWPTIKIRGSDKDEANAVKTTSTSKGGKETSFIDDK